MNASISRPTAVARVAEPTARHSASPASTLPLYGGSVRDALAWHLPKYLAEGVIVTRDSQVEVSTWPGRLVFGVDFLIEVGGPNARRLAIMVAGSTRLRDHIQERRYDARLVATGAVDVVYRVSGQDVVAQIADVVLLLAAWERAAGAGRYLPDPFSERGRMNLSRLAGREARATEVHAAQPSAQVVFRGSEDGRRRVRRLRASAPHLLVRRFDRRYPAAWEAYAAPQPRPVEQFVIQTAA